MKRSTHSGPSSSMKNVRKPITTSPTSVPATPSTTPDAGSGRGGALAGHDLVDLFDDVEFPFEKAEWPVPLAEVGEHARHRVDEMADLRDERRNQQ